MNALRRSWRTKNWENNENNEATEWMEPLFLTLSTECFLRREIVLRFTRRSVSRLQSVKPKIRRSTNTHRHTRTHTNQKKENEMKRKTFTIDLNRCRMLCCRVAPCVSEWESISKIQNRKKCNTQFESPKYFEKQKPMDMRSIFIFFSSIFVCFVRALHVASVDCTRFAVLGERHYLFFLYFSVDVSLHLLVLSSAAAWGSFHLNSEYCCVIPLCIGFTNIWISHCQRQTLCVSKSKYSKRKLRKMSRAARNAVSQQTKSIVSIRDDSSCFSRILNVIINNCWPPVAAPPLQITLFDTRNDGRVKW